MEKNTSELFCALQCHLTNLKNIVLLQDFTGRSAHFGQYKQFLEVFYIGFQKAAIGFH